jgi:hypothetical protein
MRQWLLAGVLALLAGVPAGAPALAAPAADQGVAVYLADGYEIAEKREETRTLPGKPPYENLTRTVHVTTYRLRKGAETVVCEVTYDSQQDSIATVCE